MINIINSGTEVPNDFFSAIRNSSLYKNKKNRGQISYSPDGRLMIDGKLVEKKADEMWKEVVGNAVVATVKQRLVALSIDEHDEDEEPTASTPTSLETPTAVQTPQFELFIDDEETPPAEPSKLDDRITLKKLEQLDERLSK